MNGTLSTREASARRAFTSGVKPNACPVAAGRLIRSGMRSDTDYADLRIKNSTRFAGKAEERR